MKLRKLIVVVPVLGIAAGIGMGVSAIAGGALGGPLPGSIESSHNAPPPTADGPDALGPAATATPLNEVILGVSDDEPTTAVERIRAKKRESGTGSGSTATATTGTSTAGGSTSGGSTSSSFKPWKKVTKVWKGDTGAFCAGLSDLRKDAGKPALASCGENSAAVAWAKKMAQTASLKHDPNGSGAEVIGYSWQVQRILTGPSGFKNSSAHMKIITKGSGGVDAKVGCYWARVQEQKTKGGQITKFDYVYCVARFSY